MVNRKLCDEPYFFPRVSILHTINPGLFARVMRLPDSARTDLLEFLGATPVADAQLSHMIDGIAEKLRCDARPSRAEAN